jgi:hypothetical protein
VVVLIQFVSEYLTAFVCLFCADNGSFATSQSRSQIPRWAKKEHMMAQHQSGETTLLGKLLGRHEDELYAEDSYVSSMADGGTSSKHHRRLALDPRSAVRPQCILIASIRRSNPFTTRGDFFLTSFSGFLFLISSR